MVGADVVLLHGCPQSFKADDAWVQWNVTALVFMLGYRAPLLDFTCCWWWYPLNCVLYWDCTDPTGTFESLEELLKCSQEKMANLKQEEVLSLEKEISDKLELYSVEEVSKTWLTTPPHTHTHTHTHTSLHPIHLHILCVFTFFLTEEEPVQRLDCQT